MDENDILRDFETTKAFLSGHFELRSGLHSDKFFQCAHLLQHPRIAEKLCATLVDKLKAAGLESQVDSVVAPALGGITVGHEVARALGVRSIFVEKKHDLLVLRRFKIAQGERFVIAEDVMTRGGRVRETIDIVEKAGGVVTAVLILVNRSGGKARFDAPVLSLLESEPTTWSPDECPLCKEEVALVHPGS